MKAIEERLEKFEKMPRMGQMMRMFSGDNVLSHVLRREGKDRCYESRTSSEKDRGSEWLYHHIHCVAAQSKLNETILTSAALQQSWHWMRLSWHPLRCSKVEVDHLRLKSATLEDEGDHHLWLKYAPRVDEGDDKCRSGPLCFFQKSRPKSCVFSKNKNQKRSWYFKFSLARFSQAEHQ